MNMVKWHLMILAVVALLFSCISSAAAASIYRNSGVNDGVLLQVPDCPDGFKRISYVSTTSNSFIKADVTAPHNDNVCQGGNPEKWHSEVHIENVNGQNAQAKEGSWRFYGVSIKPDESGDYTSERVMVQWMDYQSQFSTDAERYKPVQFLTIRREGTGVQSFNIRRFVDTTDAGGLYFPSFASGSLYGNWHNFVVQTRFRRDTQGLIKVWYNGQLVLDKQQIVTMPRSAPNNTIRFTTGNYAFWTAGYTPPSTAHATNYVDQISLQVADDSTVTWGMFQPT